MYIYTILAFALFLQQANSFNFSPRRLIKSLLSRRASPDSQSIPPSLQKPKIANNIVECIGMLLNYPTLNSLSQLFHGLILGGTPIVRLNRLSEGVGANILLKLESMEPCNSVKDRIG
jgi:hypothetical protein